MIIIDLIWFAFIGKGANLCRIGWGQGKIPEATIHPKSTLGFEKSGRARR